MKPSQVYFLFMTLYRISKGHEGEITAPTKINNQVNSEEDNEEHLRREGSSMKRMCFNVSLQMSAKVMMLLYISLYKFKITGSCTFSDLLWPK